MKKIVILKKSEPLKLFISRYGLDKNDPMLYTFIEDVMKLAEKTIYEGPVNEHDILEILASFGTPYHNYVLKIELVKLTLDLINEFMSILAEYNMLLKRRVLTDMDEETITIVVLKPIKEDDDV